MNEDRKKILQSGLNRMLEDGYKKIKAKHLWVYSKNDIDIILESLQDWSQRGMLRIIKPYHECEPDEYCIEMLKFIDQKSPIKGYMNWESE